MWQGRQPHRADRIEIDREASAVCLGLVQTQLLEKEKRKLPSRPRAPIFTTREFRRWSTPIPKSGAPNGRHAASRGRTCACEIARAAVFSFEAGADRQIWNS